MGFASGQSSRASLDDFDAADNLVGGQSLVFFGRVLTPQTATPSQTGPSLQEDLFQDPLATALPPAAATATTLTLGPSQATATVAQAGGLSGSTAGEQLSAAIDIGDFNGDGYDDFMLTDEPAPGYVGPVMSYILYGPVNLSTVTDVTARADLVVIDRYQGMAAPASAPAMGMPASKMGDVTGDGLSDLVFVDDEVSSSGINGFTVRVVTAGYGLGSTLPRLLNSLIGSSSEALKTFTSASTSGVNVASWAATAASGAVQTNVTAQVLHWHESSTADIFVSSTQASGSAQLGFVFSTASGFNLTNPILAVTPVLAITPPAGSVGYTDIVATDVGDVNGDGLDDIVVTNTTYNPPYSGQGAILLLYYQSSLFQGEADPSGALIVKSMGSPDAQYSSVNTTYASITDKIFPLGDINGDGYQDFATVQETVSQSELERPGLPRRRHAIANGRLHNR